MSHDDEQAPIRERWTARPAGRDDEATAGALLRTAAEHGPLTEKRLAEIHTRLRRNRGPRSLARPAPRLLRQLVFAAGLLLFGGVLSAAVMQVMRKPLKQPEAAPAPVLESKKKPARRPPAGRAPTEETATTEPEALAPDLPPPGPPVAEVPPSVPQSQSQAPASASAPRLPVPHRRVAIKDPFHEPIAPQVRSAPLPTVTPSAPTPSSLAPAAMPSPSLNTPVEHPVPTVAPTPALPTPTPSAPLPIQPEPSRLARESRWLASAIGKLRQEGQPEQALAILDQHRAELGAGALAAEASATRIEALLRMGRNGQALEILDGQRLSARGLEREMLVARAELRAERGRNASAMHDFDLILSAPGRVDGLTERALYGRATCRAKNGDRNGAHDDLAKYLEAFPQGRFAPEARAALSQQLR